MTQQSDRLVVQVLDADVDPRPFSALVRDFRQMGGSGRGAARLAGVSESSFRRWAQGTVPKAATQHKLAAAMRDARTGRKTDGGVMLDLVSHDRRRPDRGRRPVPGEKLELRPGTVDRMREKWVLTGDSLAAARVFVAGIGNPWYKDRLSAAINAGIPRAARSSGGGTGSGTGGSSSGSGGSASRGGSDDDEDLDYDYEPEYVDSGYGVSIG